MRFRFPQEVVRHCDLHCRIRGGELSLNSVIGALAAQSRSGAPMWGLGVVMPAQESARLISGDPFAGAFTP